MIHPVKIIIIPERKLAGKMMIMSFNENRTSDLWRSFMPLRNNSPGRIGNNLFSVQIYKEDFFSSFNPENKFEKWAAAEVTGFENIPEEFETLVIPEGLYAVFHYQGSPENAAPFFNEIFQEWLPSSGYKTDNRPHFEILGEKYKNNDPSSEEDIFIPVKI